MDGLEWKRDKWNAIVKKLALWFEKLGAKYSDYLVSDNREIRNYLQRTYNTDSTFIAYGATLFNNPQEKVLKEYNIEAGSYDIIIARLEKENNVETALDGVILSKSSITTLVIGNNQTEYGNYLKEKYKSYSHIRFMGGIYNLDHLNNLRWYSRFYFHGHSVGGTNPSLLEAMSSGAFILAHDNLFNRDVLGTNAYYFGSPEEAAKLLSDPEKLLTSRQNFINANFLKIENEYNWQKITNEYEQLFKTVLTSHNK
jgi:glycosyltransferase involved in cell wall biosynthesis